MQAPFAHVAPLLTDRVLPLRFRADPWFHGNTLLGAFTSSRGTVAFVCEDALDVEERGRLRAFLPDVRIVVIDRATSLGCATNALQVHDTVLAPVGLPAFVHAEWRALGLRVVELALPALFGAGGGAAVCLTNRVDDAALADVPTAFHYARARAAIVASARDRA